MADLKLVVAGASGRMGRTLIREIAQGSGITLCGALEVEGHPNLGMDSGTLAGMQANGITLTADPSGMADSTIRRATVTISSTVGGETQTVEVPVTLTRGSAAIGPPAPPAPKQTFLPVIRR